MAERLHREAALPAIVDQRAHRHRVPFGRAFVTVEKGCGDGILSVGKDIRLYGYAFAERAFGRKPAAIDPRRDVFDDDTDFTHRLRSPDSFSPTPRISNFRASSRTGSAAAADHSGVRIRTDSGGRRRLRE